MTHLNDIFGKMPDFPEPREVPHLTIIGRIWFKTLTGNTYQSVEIYQTSVLLIRIPFFYGYGDQYKQRAFEELIKLGYYCQGEYRKFNFSLISGGDGHLFIASNVKRKRDL